MSANTDNQENHWPGYVDALTTMTMVLTFVMMVLGISIFSLSQNVSRTLIEKVAKAAKVESESPTESSEDLVARIVDRIDQLAPVPPVAEAAQRPAPQASGFPSASASTTREERIVSEAEAAPEPAPQDARLTIESGQLRIVFKPRATQIDDAARERLVAHFKSIPEVESRGRIEIRAGLDSANPAVSDARRVAFYRAMRLRSEVIARGVAADRILLKIEPGLPGDEVAIRMLP
jgi:hypothetical protein